MREIRIAMADIVQDDTHILQLRNHDPNKAAAGLIGFFGGQLEEGESSEQALHRELGEETTADPRLGSLTKIGPFAVTMEHDGETLEIVGDCYRLQMPLGTVVEAKEGSIVTMTDAELLSRTDEMSPATKEAIRRHY